MAEARPKVIVVQYGARRQYAVPAALARADMLEALYTDSCAGRGLGRFAPLLAKLPGGGRFANLANRVPPLEVLARTRTFGMWSVRHDLWANHRPTMEARAHARHEAQLLAGESMIRAGFGDATHVYSMFGEGQRFLTVARDRGLKVLTDVNVAMSAEAIMVDEQKRFADWEPPALFWGQTLPGFRPTAAMLEATHLFLCPSEFVQDDLVVNFGVARERTRLFPYAVNPRWFDLDQQPEPGRILFAGTADLRKGTHYYAMAADILRARGRTYEFVVAGHASDTFRSHPVTRHLTFLGRLPRAAMPDEFARADVLVLPSLAEGSAGVTYEALGAGIPLVTTRAAGSVARDGIEGRIVPERDPEALADAIEAIVEDRSMRGRMAIAARERARAFTWERFGERLIDAVTDAGIAKDA